MQRRGIPLLVLMVVLAACGSLETQPPTARPTIELKRAVNLPSTTGDLPTIPADDPRAQGDPNAPVTLIEYSDFQCPFCQQHEQTVYPELIKQYVETGQVRYVFRNYIAVPEHLAAPAAGVAGLCAAKQDQFWAMHDMLFERANAWSADPDTAPDYFARYAELLGLDVAAFKECQADPAMRKQVDAESLEAQSLGADATPSFFIGKYYIRGAQSLPRFASAIEGLQDSANE